MQTKLTFFKSYYKLGWWAARMPKGAWAGREVELLGFGVTQTQAVVINRGRVKRGSMMSSM